MTISKYRVTIQMTFEVTTDDKSSVEATAIEAQNACRASFLWVSYKSRKSLDAKSSYAIENITNGEPDVLAEDAG